MRHRIGGEHTMKTKKRLLSILLSLVMVLGLMPGMSLTALAIDLGSVTTYPLWVGGTQVTSENAADNEGTRGWSYTPATSGDNPTPATLTLNNYTYTGTESEYATIGTTEDLTINLVGNNTITNTSTNNNSFGIFVEDNQNQKNLTITGNGTLNVNGGNSASTYSCGIYVNGSLTIDVNTTVKANGGSCADSAGVAAIGGLHVKGTLEAIGGSGTNSSYGIYNTQVEIAEGSVVTAIGGTQAIYEMVNNAIAGAGWMNMEGTEGEREIDANIGGQYLSHDKKVQFPAPGTEGNPWLIGKVDAADVKAWLTGDGNNKTLHISGTGAMKNFNYRIKDMEGNIEEDIPWYSNNSGSSQNPAEQIKTVDISSGVTSIGNYAFIRCSNLEYVTIPTTVTSIGSYAFCECSKLASVTIPAGVTEIGQGAFVFCGALQSAVIPDTVTSIGSEAFRGCDLRSVTIPGSVTQISSFTFGNNKNLPSISHIFPPRRN